MRRYEPNTVEQFYAAKYFCENFRLRCRTSNFFSPHAAVSYCAEAMNVLYNRGEFGTSFWCVTCCLHVPGEVSDVMEHAP
jgi:hypothetical protein